MRIWLLVLIFTCPCFAKPAVEANRLADAIFGAEGVNSKHPYGILKHYKHTGPRQVCLNTIASNYRRWDGQGDFIEYLSRVYCPVGASNDPHGLNVNWSRNVKHYYGG